MTKKINMKWIAGFWRRIGALLIDTIILGLFGFGLGLVFEKQFVELGGWGRLLGFCIALLYFGVLNSKITGGQTIGKKLLSLRVVNADNQAIDVPRSFARYSIIGIPFFLNGAHFTGAALTSIWLYPLSFVIFGGLLSIVYLYIFNRVTRQSLHDLIVGTFVVNAKIEQQVAGDIWKPHLIVVAALFVVAAIAPVFTSNLAKSEPFNELLQVQNELMKNPSVSYATTFYGTSSFTATNESKKVTSYVGVQAFLKANTVADQALAHQLAEIVTSNFADAINKDVIQIDLRYGYDIGIASLSRNQMHTFNPKDLAVRK